jgi:murein peptide amidase A
VLPAWIRSPRRRPALVAGALVCAAAGFAVYGLAAASGAAPVEQRILGHSVRGRPIRAYVVGDPAARHSVLVVGCIHGDETAGEAVTKALRHELPPRGVKLWLVDQFNPDGCIAHTRGNADGVDLNRNSPWHWRPLGGPGGTFYSGPRPLSEPESRVINRFIKRARPAVSIWYHQHAALVDDGSGGSIALERRYATISGLPLLNYGVRPGSIITWQDTTFRDDTAFDVELPAGALSKAEVDRHVAAVLALARIIGRG